MSDEDGRILSRPVKVSDEEWERIFRLDPSNGFNPNPPTLFTSQRTKDIIDKWSGNKGGINIQAYETGAGDG